MDRPRFPLDAPAYEELEEEQDDPDPTDDAELTETEEEVPDDAHPQPNTLEDSPPTEPTGDEEEDGDDGPSLLTRFAIWLGLRFIMFLLFLGVLYFALEALLTLF